MYTYQSKRKPEKINVVVNNLFKDIAYLKIDPFDEGVKDILKSCSGCKGWIPQNKNWKFDVRQISNLDLALHEFSVKTGIPVYLLGLEKVQSYIEALELEKKINNPTILDYKENEEFYLSLDTPQKKKSPTKKNKRKDNKNNPGLIKTQETQHTAKYTLAIPVLSAENCAYRSLCTNCLGQCVDFRSVSESYTNNNLALEDLQSVSETTNIYTPDTLWHGKSKAAAGTGYFEGDPKGFFVVRKGSCMSEKRTVQLAQTIVDTRNRLKKEKFVDENNTFIRDYPFTNVGTATAVLTGSTSSWKTFWEAENSVENNCKGDILNHYAPTFAHTELNGHKIVGMPIVMRDEETKKTLLKFKLLEGNVVKFNPEQNLSQKHRKIQREVKDILNKQECLKADYMFESADDAAKVITGNKNADASIWATSSQVTMQEIQLLRSRDTFDGHTVYHLEKPTLGTAAALYIQKNDAGKEEYVVMKGSIITPFLNKSCPENCRKLYLEMHKNGDIMNGVVTRDIAFNSASAAANVCAGRSMNGNKEWITLTGEVLKKENRSVKKPRI